MSRVKLFNTFAPFDITSTCSCILYPANVNDLLMCHYFWLLKMPKNTYSGHQHEKGPKKCAFDHWQITVWERARKDAGKRGAGVRVSSPIRWDARDALRRATRCLRVPRQSLVARLLAAQRLLVLLAFSCGSLRSPLKKESLPAG